MPASNCQKLMFCQTFGIRDMRHYGTFPGMRLAFPAQWVENKVKEDL